MSESFTVLKQQALFLDLDRGKLNCFRSHLKTSPYPRCRYPEVLRYSSIKVNSKGLNTDCETEIVFVGQVRSVEARIRPVFCLLRRLKFLVDIL